jgi:RNA polymerase sigma factor (sigma-70 family)
MQAKSDALLLREYARLGSEAAFREIVVRYTDLIYSTVLRKVGRADLAEDVAQSVFTDLARKAPSLARTLAENGTIVVWIYRSARFAVSKQLRAENRRHIRESLAMQEFDATAAASPDWESVRPKLDEALADLSEEDRQAMLLRYFQGRDFQAIGAVLGVSDDTAQKRVARALEKLRTRLARHGITTTASMLSAVLSTNAIQTAPVGLAARLAGASLASAASSTGTTLTIMALTSFKTGIIAMTIAASLAIWLAAEYRSLHALQDENAALREQMSQPSQPPETSLPQNAISQENSDRDELEKLRREHEELLKLRGDVGVLRDTADKKQAELDAIEKANEKREQQANYKNIVVKAALEIVGRASRTYAMTHDGLLPTDYEQIRNQNNGNGGKLLDIWTQAGGFATNFFAFFNYDTPLSTNMPPYCFYAAENLAREMPDGQIHRDYLLVDGSVQEAASGNGNFDTWESEWLQSHQSTEQNGQ